MFINFTPKFALFTFLFLGIQFPVLANLSDSFPVEWDFQPPKTGQPDQREGAATRGPCLKKTPSLVALTPPSSYGLTTTSNPTFFWFLPENEAEKLKFILTDKQGITIYALEYLLPPTLTPKIMGLTLPDFISETTLTNGQKYAWRVELYCEANDVSPVTFVQSSLERVEPKSSFPPNLKDISLYSQVTIYGEAGIWYETLLSLVKLRQLYPNIPEFESAWLKLLNSINLEKIAQDTLKAEIELN